MSVRVILGYVIAHLAVAAGRDNPMGLWVWLMLGGTFFVDATVVRRCCAVTASIRRTAVMLINTLVLLGSGRTEHSYPIQ
jgi:hypothetical protein